MSKKLTWKRTNDAGQTESHCGRYWFTNLVTNTSRPSSYRLWHADTESVVGHYTHKADAKVAAEKHLAGFAEEVRKLRHRVVDLEVAVEEHEQDWESLTATDAN